MGPTVLIVDDHADFRAFARALLAAGGFEVVGEAPDGAAALSQARALKPDLVLLDIQLPDIEGFAACDQLAADAAPPAVVLTSSRDASSYRRRLGREQRARVHHEGRSAHHVHQMTNAARAGRVLRTARRQRITRPSAASRERAGATRTRVRLADRRIPDGLMDDENR